MTKPEPTSSRHYTAGKCQEIVESERMQHLVLLRQVEGLSKKWQQKKKEVPLGFLSIPSLFASLL